MRAFGLRARKIRVYRKAAIEAIYQLLPSRRCMVRVPLELEERVALKSTVEKRSTEDWTFLALDTESPG